MRLVSMSMLVLVATAANAAAPLVVYDNALQSGFADSSWANTADYSLINTTPTYAGSTDSIRFVARNWGGLQLVAGANEFSVADYQSLTFYINGGNSGGQLLQAYVCDNYGAISQTYPLSSQVAGGVIPPNSWALVTLDFNSAGLTHGTFNCLVIMDANGSNDAGGQPAVFIDQIVFNARTTPLPSGVAVNVSVNAGAVGNAINPRIFGVAYGNATRNRQMGYTVDRWGGNSTTRYNWQADIHNTANDYYFENIPDCTAPTCIGTPPAGNSADTFISGAIGAGAQPLLTIPTIGWTPRADSATQHPYTVGFSVAKYGPQQAVDPYDPNAGNGYYPSRTPVTGNDPADTSVAAAPGFEQAWIAHLQSTFGTAANGGVKLFTLDNEVMLWNSTHRDVHPAPATYDEIWNKTVAYASAIKLQEPNALVTGPVTWGYCDLFSSAADSAAGNCTNGADRSNHGGLPFVAWYLQQVCANPLASGMHLVDYLDLHWYPQDPNGASGSIYSNANDPGTIGRRLRSLKELYDPTWISESWIGTLGDSAPDYLAAPDFIPRVKAWIDQYCPGTKLAITEYAWDQDNTDSGAVAEAEALAIFAREGVDLATRWIAPAANSLAERGYSIFLDYDGSGAKVQGNSIGAISANVDQIGAYAFHGNARTFVLLTNKDTAAHDVTLSFDASHTAAWKLYGFTGTTALAQTGSGNVAGAALTLAGLPAMSANLLVIPDNDEIFKNGFE